MSDHTIDLTATAHGNTIKISGNGGAQLPKNSGSHRFKFTLSSPPGLVVRFASLDCEDNCSTCPPAQGDNSTQIRNVNIDPDGLGAKFTDANNNKGGNLDISYQWNFTCDDPTKTVEPFDPVIKNGGGGTVRRSLAIALGVVGLAVIIALTFGFRFGQAGQ